MDLRITRRVDPIGQSDYVVYCHATSCLTRVTEPSPMVFTLSANAALDERLRRTRATACYKVMIVSRFSSQSLPRPMPTQASLLLRHHRPFMAFWLARVCTTSGFQMLTVAIGWHLYQLTGSVLDLGLVGLVEFAPRVLFMLHTGHVADRYDRRKVAALFQAAQALIALALVIASSTDSVSRDLIFVLAFLLGGARSFEIPTTQALLPNIVPAALFPRAVAA